MIGSTGFAGKAKPAAAYGFLSNWAAATPSVMTVNGDVIKSQMSERFIRVGTDTVPVAIMTTGEIRAKSKKGIPTDFEGSIAKLMGIKHWKKETRGNYVAMEAEVPGSARLVKVFVSKNPKVYRYSIVSIRTAFMLPTYYEAEILQRIQMKDDKGVAELEKPSSTTAKIYRFLLAPSSAQASTLDDLLDLASSSANSVSGAAKQVGTFTTTSVSAVNGLTGSVTTAGANITGTMSTVGTNLTTTASTLGNNVVTTVNNGVGNLTSTVNNGVGNLTSTANNVMSTASTTVTNATTSLHGDVTTASNAINNASSTADKDVKYALNPVNDFKAALGAGLGYSLGTMLVQFAADGGAAICKQIFYAITGRLPDNVQNSLNDQGKQAWADLERLSKEALELDKKMQLTLMSMAALSGKNPINMYQSLPDKEIALQSDMRRLQGAMDNFKNTDTRNICIQAYREDAQQLLIVQNLQPIFAAPEVKRPQDLCNSFDDLYKQWASLELQIANARNILLKNMSFMITGAAKEAAKAGAQDFSPRQAGKNCAQLEDAVDKADSEIGKNNCYCGNGGISSKCYNACQKRVLSKGILDDCNSVVDMNKARDTDSDDVISMQAVKQSSDMMKDSYKKLVGSYCEAGSTQPGCNGDQGSFAKIHDALQDRFKYVQVACPNGITKAQPADVQAGAAKADAMENSDVPLASATGSQLPTSSDSPGFFSRLGSAIRNIF